jgi:hypothetical protein
MRTSTAAASQTARARTAWPQRNAGTTSRRTPGAPPCRDSREAQRSRPSASARRGSGRACRLEAGPGSTAAWPQTRAGARPRPCRARRSGESRRRRPLERAQTARRSPRQTAPPKAAARATAASRARRRRRARRRVPAWHSQAGSSARKRRSAPSFAPGTARASALPPCPCLVLYSGAWPRASVEGREPTSGRPR